MMESYTAPDDELDVGAQISKHVLQSAGVKDLPTNDGADVVSSTVATSCKPVDRFLGM